MFSRRPQKLMKSSQSIWRYVVSKRQIDGEDFVNFRGLHRKYEFYFSYFFASIWVFENLFYLFVCPFLLPNLPKLIWFYPFLRFWKKDSAIVGISSSPKWRDLEAFLFGLVTKRMPIEQFVSIFLKIPYFLI